MFFRCNNMYQPVPSTFPLHCKRFTYISNLCFSAFLFSYRPSSSGGQHLHIIIPNIAYHDRKTHAQPSCFRRNPGEMEKKLLDDGGSLLGRVLLFSTRACCFSFLLAHEASIPNCNHFGGKGGITTLFCLSFSFFSALSLRSFSSIPNHKPKRLA